MHGAPLFCLLLFAGSTMSGPVDAIHGKAIDRACNDDRLWFEANAEREFRLRDPVPFEFNGPVETPPKGSTWRVLVKQVKLGVRLRLPVALPIEAHTQGAEDRHLRPLYKQLVGPVKG